MTVEIEAKMKLNDVAALEQRLDEAGATLRRRVFEVNSFYDTAEGSMRAADRGLRTRLERGLDDPDYTRMTITHKGPRAHGKLKSRSEVELYVTNLDDADAMLRSLGYQKQITFEKRRHKWDFDDCLIEVDTVPYLGSFVEVEGPSDEKVLEVRETLGLGDEPMIRASYIAMLKTYITEHHIRTDHIGFDKAEKTATTVA